MENIELENKAEKAPKAIKKTKDFFSADTYEFLTQVLTDFAIEPKHRPKLKEILASVKPETKSNSI